MIAAIFGGAVWGGAERSFLAEANILLLRDGSASGPMQGPP